MVQWGGGGCGYSGFNEVSPDCKIFGCINVEYKSSNSKISKKDIKYTPRSV